MEEKFYSSLNGTNINFGDKEKLPPAMHGAACWREGNCFLCCVREQNEMGQALVRHTHHSEGRRAPFYDRSPHRHGQSELAALLWLCCSLLRKISLDTFPALDLANDLSRFCEFTSQKKKEKTKIVCRFKLIFYASMISFFRFAPCQTPCLPGVVQ